MRKKSRVCEYSLYNFGTIYQFLFPYYTKMMSLDVYFGMIE